MEKAIYKLGDGIKRLVGEDYYLAIESPKEGDLIEFEWNGYKVEYNWWGVWDKVSKEYLDSAARREVNKLKADIKVAKQDGTLVTYKYDKRIPDPDTKSVFPVLETYKWAYLD